ncbi:MAG: thiol-disulfide oxidoreductase DCC family protein [bacterium]
MGRDLPEDVVFYDGHCALCNGTVKFILNWDKGGQFTYAPLQGDLAGKHLNIDNEDLSSVIYRRERNGSVDVYRRSDAIFEILKELGGIWRILAVLQLIPRFIRDAFYNLIARYRYRVFGQYDECPLPDPEVRDRFLELG